MSKKLKVIELFSGIGSQTQALKNIGIEHEVVAIAEIDKFAITSYEALHGKTRNLGDVSKVGANEIPDCDLLTYSFPCQNISSAGKQEGFSKGSGTSSGLLWECERIIKAKLPKYLLMENVKALVSKKFKAEFLEWCKLLEDLGYTNYWKVLNAKDFSIPQSRERVFMVSILNDTNKNFEFPEKKESSLLLKDFLEDKVGQEFYLKDESVLHLLKNSNFSINVDKKVIGSTHKDPDNHIGHRYIVHNTEAVSPTLLASDYKGQKQILQIGNSAKNINRFGGNPTEGRVYSVEGINPTLTTGKQIQILIEPPLTASMRGRADNPDEKRSQRIEVRKESITNTLTTVQKDNILIDGVKYYKDNNGLIFTVRKLTPREYWRLMGFKDEQFNKVENLVSKTQLYKQAGNSIVVNVLEEIFKAMFMK